MTKRGFTILEVVVSVAIISTIFLSILILLSLVSNYQLKKEDAWKTHRLIENIHALYLADPTYFDIGENTIYFNENFILVVDEKDAYFTVTYTLEFLNDIYELEIHDLHTKVYTYKSIINLGKWVVS
ncbi:prepilin-type N-terminal cleavage/methylation domain-containing protein [Acholeplasma equirhinis]|uniref:type II secretion system protein n=1 Tax=Acholeplasma equirhinis TaxID=555393 RepID=UPI00197AAB3A|nr:prepilin-type N-terminal cleavage/methylation domain-containing protein [Acholeplasma equirhinis]MBN3489908.1 prepilin-type N-terminal cleavage/methylation domain-containing protein [Acholeplasma equirhinis]